jgi:hypothetical protein
LDYQIKDDEVSEACDTNGCTRKAYRVLGGTPEGKKPFGKVGIVGRIILEC